MKKIATVIILMLCILNISSCNRAAYLEVHIIDVDQGESSLIVTKDRYTMLIDCGEERYYRNVLRHLKKNRIKKIDYLIGTHFDSDHIGAMDKIIKNIQVKKVILPKDSSSKKELVEVVNVCDKFGIKIESREAGDTFKVGSSTYVYVLSPSKIGEDSNENSLVMDLSYKNRSLIFTGDAGIESEKNILQKFNIGKCDFLKVGHHGSKNSTGKEFINILKPSISSISCGYKNRYGHPHQEVVEILKENNSKIFRTDVNGSMVFYFDEDKIFQKEKYQYE